MNVVVAVSTFALAIATGVLAFATWRLAKRAERQVELQAEQLAASQRAIVYPIAPWRWAGIHEESTAGILLKNGGNGPALRVRGTVRFPAVRAKQRIGETTLGAGEEQLIRLNVPGPGWLEANGRLDYTDLTGYQREVLFVYEHAEGSNRLVVRVEHRELGR